MISYRNISLSGIRSVSRTCNRFFSSSSIFPEEKSSIIENPLYLTPKGQCQ